MHDHTVNMFSIPLAHYVVRDWEVKKEQLLLLLNQSNLRLIDNCKTSLDSQNKNLNTIFNEEINLFLDEFQFQDYEIIESWFHVEEQNMYRGIHNHGYGVSAMCYIEFDNNEHVPIEFLSPFNNILNGEPQIYIPEVYEGSLIFFPSCINHYTSPNNSQKKKITSSFHMKMK